MPAPARAHLTITQAVARMPGPANDWYDVLFRHGTLEAGYYAPRPNDPQQPHARDELYVVASGSGWFVNGPERHRFAAGDVLFVAAGVVHRFEEFSDDFAAWVFFYGPEGGEEPAAPA